MEMVSHQADGERCAYSLRQRVRRGMTWVALGAMLLTMERGGEPFGEVPYLPGSYVVAMGDSITSGEGNPPFMAGTAGQCNRSTAAYPQQLADRYGLGLRNVACSGANIDDIAQGKFGEPGQLDALDSTVRLVFITAGISETHLYDFAVRCTEGDRCESGVDPATDEALDRQRQHTPPRLAALYVRIAQQAPQADIFVVQYPQLANSQDGCLLPGFPNLSRTTERYIAATNQAILQAARQANTELGAERIIVVPSAQRSACQRPLTTVWWTNEQNPTGMAHPNTSGHFFIAAAVAEQMTRHCDKVAARRC